MEIQSLQPPHYARAQVYFDQSICPNIPNCDSKEEKEVFIKWGQSNILVKGLMKASMTLDLQSQFAHVISTGKLNQALDKAYGIVNPRQRNEAFSLFMCSRMKETVNSSNFLMPMMEHRNEAEIHGVKMDESDQIV